MNIRNKKIINFMNYLEWEGQSNWEKVSDKHFATSLAELKQWISQNSQHIGNRAALTQFKDFMGGDISSSSSYNYTLKNIAQEAFYALYHKEVEQWKQT